MSEKVRLSRRTLRAVLNRFAECWFVGQVADLRRIVNPSGAMRQRASPRPSAALATSLRPAPAGSGFAYFDFAYFDTVNPST